MEAQGNNMRGQVVRVDDDYYLMNDECGLNLKTLERRVIDKYDYNFGELTPVLMMKILGKPVSDMVYYDEKHGYFLTFEQGGVYSYQKTHSSVLGYGVIGRLNSDTFLKEMEEGRI